MCISRKCVMAMIKWKKNPRRLLMRFIQVLRLGCFCLFSKTRKRLTVLFYFFCKIVKRNRMHFNRIDCHVMHICSFTLFCCCWVFLCSLIVIYFFSSKNKMCLAKKEKRSCQQIGFFSSVKWFSSEQFALCVCAHVCLHEIYAEKLLIRYTYIRDEEQAQKINK